MRTIRVAILILLIAPLALVIAILLDGLTDNVVKSDVGIVLGSKVMPDGTPSARLRARLDKADELFQSGMFKYVIVSGGTGREGPNEARVMADYLAGEKKVPREAIILDEHGNTTQATARNSASIMKQRGLTSAVIVTQYFHITGTRYALRRAGVTTVSTAHARYFEMRDLYSIAREVIALPVYWLASLAE
jgi:vancomycin permeability regulator SanA